MGQKRTPAPTMVETINAEGKQVQCTTQELVKAAIHGEISPQFSRAGSAPICNGPMFELLGYGADTEAGVEILEGTFEPPPGTDPATIIILNSFGVKAVYIRLFRKPIGLAEQRPSRAPSR